MKIQYVWKSEPQSDLTTTKKNVTKKGSIPASNNFNIEGIDFKSHHNRTTQSNKSWRINASKMTESKRIFLDPNARDTTSKMSKTEN